MERKVNWPKWRGYTGIGFFGLFLLFSHQNCAPVYTDASTSSVAASEADLPVSQIDGVKGTAGLKFNFSEIEIQNQANDVLLEGVCSTAQEASILGWTMQELGADGESAREFARGFSRCSGGSFTVELADASDLICDRAYRVVARLGLAEPGETLVTRKCSGVH